MLYVDEPHEFNRLLPGILPASLAPAAPDEEYPPGQALAAALFGPEAEPWVTGDHPPAVDGGTWDAWYLAARPAASQYDRLREALGRIAAPPGRVVCLAAEGSGMHGQEGRPWAAAAGNLHLTVGLAGDLDAAVCGLAPTMLPAVAVAQALAGLGTGAEGLPAVGIKWINDVVIGGRKAGGVLTAVRTEQGRIRSLVLGIGLNLAVRPTVPPTDVTPAVTCLNDHLAPGTASLPRVLGAVLRQVARRFDELAAEGPAPLLAAYRDQSAVLGRRVQVRAADGSTRRGRVLDIGPDLALILSDDRRPVTVGRLVLEPEEGTGPVRP